MDIQPVYTVLFCFFSVRNILLAAFVAVTKITNINSLKVEWFIVAPRLEI